MTLFADVNRPLVQKSCGSTQDKEEAVGGSGKLACKLVILAGR